VPSHHQLPQGEQQHRRAVDREGRDQHDPTAGQGRAHGLAQRGQVARRVDPVAVGRLDQHAVDRWRGVGRREQRMIVTAQVTGETDRPAAGPEFHCG